MTSVVDGDTVVISPSVEGGSRVRLIGMDTPEVSAFARRKPAPDLVHHLDRGDRYTAFSFSERPREVGITPSMGRARTALDNAMVESFVST